VSNSDKLFEFRMGEMFEDPAYEGLWTLREDVDYDKVYLKLTIFMMEFLEFEESDS